MLLCLCQPVGWLCSAHSIGGGRGGVQALDLWPSSVLISLCLAGSNLTPYLHKIPGTPYLHKMQQQCHCMSPATTSLSVRKRVRAGFIKEFGYDHGMKKICGSRE